MNRILVLTAVELEASTLARQLELPAMRCLPFRAFGRGRLCVAPVGLRAAFLPDRWPHLVAGPGAPLVVSAGVCGGLDPGLGTGDLVLPDSVLGPSGELLDVDPASHRLALGLAGGLARTGRLVTVPEVVATSRAKAELRARTGAAVVDLESAVILRAAAAARCPALVVRGVADHAGQALPAALLGLVTPQGRVRVGGALALALSRPRVIPQALELRRGTRQALAAVARAIGALAA